MSGGRDRPADTAGAPAPRPPGGAGRAVIAVGIDIESVERVGRLLARYGPRFVERVFTPGEAAYGLRRRHPAQHLAARFAAKEAAMKALGTGRSAGVLWRSIEVVRSGGPPQLRFHDEAARRFDALGGREALITMSHSGDFALAQVLLLGA